MSDTNTPNAADYLIRAVLDDEFRRLALTSPEQAFAAFALTAEEQDFLRARDERMLALLGAAVRDSWSSGLAHFPVREDRSAIEPAAAEPTDTYVGKTASLELRFHNDKTSGAVEVFPEPPLVVKHLPTQRECRIDDGGIWVRQHVYASTQGQVLVTHEYSGSNDQLVFYDTRTCAKLASIDVSNKTWAVDGGAVLLTTPNAARKPLRVGLDAACLPVKSASPRVRR